MECINRKEKEMKRSSLLVVASLAAISGYGAVRYVAVDGMGDGLSADAPMASLADAYVAAADGATKENPGIVYVSSGMYRLQAPLELKANVNVVGGIGGRTVISGDNMKTAARAAYWSENLIDSTSVIKPGISKTPIWNDDLTFNEPNAENDESWFSSWHGNSPCNTDQGFVNTVSDIGECTFENISFTLFNKGTFQFSAGRLILKGCSFIGDCSKAISENVSAVVAEGTASVCIDKCEFIGCAGALRLSGSGESQVTDAIFRENSYQNVVTALDTHKLTMRRCSFFRNWATQSGEYAIVRLQSNTLGNLIEECTFATNFVTGVRKYGNEKNGSSGILYLHGATNRVRKCNFEGNCNIDKSYEYSSGNRECLPAYALLRTESKYAEVSECSFVGNRLKVSSADANNPALINYISVALKHTVFYNCHFGANRVEAADSGNAALFHRSNGAIAFVHSVISGNEYIGADVVPFYSSYNGGNETSTIFCNVVFDEPGFDGSPFRFLKPQLGAPALYSSVVDDFDEKYFTYTDDSRVASSHFASSALSERAVKLEDGRMFCRLSSSSAFRKIGRPVYVDASGVAWMYLPQSDNWHRFDTGSENDTPEGFEMGVTPLSRDAQGAQRVYGKIAPGALNAAQSGFGISIR